MSVKHRDLQTFLANHKELTESFLASIVPNNPTDGSKLIEAMRYSLLNNGKRLRPSLVYACGQALGVPIENLHAAAASVELIHSYSLVHDDLPAMDDDDLRRGMPTCHKAYNEALAILVGDALQALAFQVLSDPELNPLEPSQQIAMVSVLAKAAGGAGMVIGQAEDIAAENKSLSLEALTRLHNQKTGALFRACVELALIASGKEADRKLKTALLNYSYHSGLAFQIQDDILDVIGDDQTLGKPQGSDQKLGKSTFVSLLGLDTAKQQVTMHLEQALVNIEIFGAEAEILKQLTVYMTDRVN